MSAVRWLLDITGHNWAELSLWRKFICAGLTLSPPMPKCQSIKHLRCGGRLPGTPVVVYRCWLQVNARTRRRHINCGQVRKRSANNALYWCEQIGFTAVRQVDFANDRRTISFPVGIENQQWMIDELLRLMITPLCMTFRPTAVAGFMCSSSLVRGAVHCYVQLTVYSIMHLWINKVTDWSSRCDNVQGSTAYTHHREIWRDGIYHVRVHSVTPKWACTLIREGN